jgi:hypothetical protein
MVDRPHRMLTQHAMQVAMVQRLMGDTHQSAGERSIEFSQRPSVSCHPLLLVHNAESLQIVKSRD